MFKLALIYRWLVMSKMAAIIVINILKGKQILAYYFLRINFDLETKLFRYRFNFGDLLIYYSLVRI